MTAPHLREPQQREIKHLAKVRPLLVFTGMETLVLVLVGLVLVSLLAVPFKYPRIGLGIGALIALAGVSIYFDRHEDAYFREMFVSISHTVGMATMLYASVWLAIGGYRVASKDVVGRVA